MEDDQKDGMLETRLVRVRGIVQGVGYREARVRRANVLGVTGWLRKRLGGGDGSGLAEAYSRYVRQVK